MFLLPLNVLCTQTPVTIQMPRIEATRDKAVCLWPRHPSLIGHLTTVRRRLTASRVPSDTTTTWPWAAPGLPEHGTAHPRCTSGGHVPRPRLGTLRTGPRPAARWTVCRGPDQSRVRLYVTPAAQAASHPAVGFGSAEPCLYRTVTVTVTTRSRPFRAPGPGPASPPVPGQLTPKTRCPRSSRAPRQRHARQAPGRPPRLGPARFLPDVVPWTPPPFRPPHVAVLCTCDLFSLKGPV